MMNGKKVFRLAASGLLLVAIVATCVGLYQADTRSKTEEKKLAQQTPVQEENLASNDETQQEAPAEDVGTSNVEGTKEVEDTAEDTQENPSLDQSEAQDAATEAQPQEAVSGDVVDQQPETPVQPALEFTEESLMEWPLTGDVVLDYSMDHTIYYPTLDLYKYNPAVIIGAEVNTPVLTVANGQVSSVVVDEETGTTVSMDMGNGYQAVYGQLKEVAFAEGDIVTMGSVLGYVSEPTKYYTVEGSNLYFALTKDGTYLDPMMYLP